MFPGETCLHCGATSDEYYSLSAHSFAILIMILAISIGTLWAFAQNRPIDEPALHTFEKSAASKPDTIVQNESQGAQNTANSSVLSLLRRQLG